MVQTLIYKITIVAQTLIYASSFIKSDRNDKIVKLLLEHNADPNVQDNIGKTALMYSVCDTKYTNPEKTVEMMLNYNANINIQDKNGNTALVYPSWASNTNSTERIIKYY